LTGSVALNKKIAVTETHARVLGDGGGTLCAGTRDFALKSMAVNGQALDGENISEEQRLQAGEGVDFKKLKRGDWWVSSQDGPGFSNEDWNIQDGRLPALKVFRGGGDAA
jgi:hypothetical protein